MIDRIISLIPLAEEHIILVLRYGGIFVAALAIMVCFRAIFLSNSLSIKRAQKLIQNQEAYLAQQAENSMPKLELHIKETPTEEKTKRPLIEEHLPEEAEALLQKMTLTVFMEGGWHTAP